LFSKNPNVCENSRSKTIAKKKRVNSMSVNEFI